MTAEISTRFSGIPQPKISNGGMSWRADPFMEEARVSIQSCPHQKLPIEEPAALPIRSAASSARPTESPHQSLKPLISRRRVHIRPFFDSVMDGFDEDSENYVGKDVVLKLLQNDASVINMLLVVGLRTSISFE
jgi:hypothetical protein